MAKFTVNVNKLTRADVARMFPDTDPEDIELVYEVPTSVINPLLEKIEYLKNKLPDLHPCKFRTESIKLFRELTGSDLATATLFIESIVVDEDPRAVEGMEKLKAECRSRVRAAGPTLEHTKWVRLCDEAGLPTNSSVDRVRQHLLS